MYSEDLANFESDIALVPGRLLECLMTETGEEYIGEHFLTKSGLRCQHWKSQTVHDYHIFIIINTLKTVLKTQIVTRLFRGLKFFNQKITTDGIGMGIGNVY